MSHSSLYIWVRFKESIDRSGVEDWRTRVSADGHVSADDRIIPLPNIAEKYFNLHTLRDVKWRARAGLPVVKLGGKIIGVRAVDLERALRLEQFDVQPSS